MRKIYVLFTALGLIVILVSCSTQKKYGCKSNINADISTEQTNEL